MGTNTIPTATSGLVIPTDDHNSIKEALTNDLVPRNTDGIATDEAGDLGSSTYRFKNLHITGDINLGSGKFIPVGTLLQTIFPATTTGYLLANGDTIGDVGSGATHESALYEPLFALCVNYFGNVGTELFANGDTVLLPDIRGYFARGWDNGRGIDSGRTINSTQADDNKAHTHTFTVNSTGGGTTAAMAGVPPVSGSGTTDSDGGTESRPKNIALNYLIKY